MVLLLLSSIFILSCSPSIPSEKQCSTAADCVPAQCCHATDAINTNYAPDCSDIFCTAVCEPSTLDCGQGEIQCVSGQCQVVLN